MEMEVNLKIYANSQVGKIIEAQERPENNGRIGPPGKPRIEEFNLGTKPGKELETNLLWLLKVILTRVSPFLGKDLP